MALTAGNHVHEQPDSGRGIRGSDSPEVAQIVCIEREDVGETPEVAGLDLSPLIMCDVRAVAARGRLRAPVGRMADMPVAGAGGIDIDRQAGLLGLGAQGRLGKRRAADIAEANEQDRRLGLVGHHRRIAGWGAPGYSRAQPSSHAKSRFISGTRKPEGIMIVVRAELLHELEEDMR